MKCRRCNHPSTRVVETRVQEDGITRRRRACDECDFRFSSYEIPPEAYSYVGAVMNKWRSRLVTPTKLASRRREVVKPAALKAFEAGQTIKQVSEQFGVSMGIAKVWSENFHREAKAERRRKIAADIDLPPAELARKHKISVDAARSWRWRLSQGKGPVPKTRDDALPHPGQSLA